LHTNGYSLARKIFFEQMGLKPESHVPELKNSIGNELLKVHLSYGTLIQDMLKRFNRDEAGQVRSTSATRRKGQSAKSKAAGAIKALAHITGGGFIDNIPRVLPSGCDVLIQKGTWDVLPIFHLIQETGAVGEEELYQVFNMGIGMVVIIAGDQADFVLRWLRKRQPAWVIGEVVNGTRRVRVV